MRRGCLGGGLLGAAAAAVARLCHSLAAVHPAVAVAVGAATALLAMALMRRLALRGRVTLMLALAVLLMLLRSLRRRGLGDGGGGDHERDRGQKDFHFLAPFGFELKFEVVRRIAEGAARPPAERRR
jgi:hypothetical protein